MSGKTSEELFNEIVQSSKLNLKQAMKELFESIIASMDDDDDIHDIKTIIKIIKAIREKYPDAGLFYCRTVIEKLFFEILDSRTTLYVVEQMSHSRCVFTNKFDTWEYVKNVLKDKDNVTKIEETDEWWFNEPKLNNTHSWIAIKTYGKKFNTEYEVVKETVFAEFFEYEEILADRNSNER